MNSRVVLLKNMLVAPRVAYARLREAPELDISLPLLVTMAVLMSVKILSAQFQFTLLNVVLAVVLALVSMMLGVTLLGFLYNWVAELFTKGDHANEMRRAIPYSYIPLIVAAVIEISFSGVEGIAIATSIAGGWSIVILTILISEIKGINVGLSLAVLVLATLLMLTPVIAVVGIKYLVQ